jgi:hypothetical protein
LTVDREGRYIQSIPPKEQTVSATTSFDLDALIDAIQTRDAAGQLALYAPDAEVHNVDQAGGPSSPRILRGHTDLEPELRDVCARDMTHAVTQAFVTGGRLAYEVTCAYPDGTRVLCQAIAALRDGQIVTQRGITVWDAQ